MSQEDNEVEKLKARVQGILDSSADDSEKIRQLHELGYTNVQLHKEFGFSKSLVYQVCPVNPEKAPQVEKHGENGFRLPATLKTGQGKETLTPEGILQSYLLEDGDAGQQLFKGFMLYRAAQLAVMNDVEIMKGQAEAQAIMIKPIVDMMIETRKEQDAAAERAKASSMDIANQAAQQTALNMANFIDQKIPKGPPPKDTSEMFTKRIDKMWEMMEHMMEQRMMPGYQQGKVPEGWESEKRRNEK
ncbi:MAG: hypothetical protein U9R04_03490 [Chloroflexota bacterium]|nr:hypothetical protein [Chloroflexota bacterium]